MNNRAILEEDVHKILLKWFPNYVSDDVMEDIRRLTTAPTFPAEGEWHKYPEEKPEEMHNYLTSQLRPNGEIILAISSMHRGKWWIEDQSFGDDTKVIAFRELPSPYQGATK